MDLISKGSSEEIKSVLQETSKKNTNVRLSPSDGKPIQVYSPADEKWHDITLH